MFVCIILLGALIVVGALLWLTHKPDAPSDDAEATAPIPVPEEECCGTHAICEKINTRRLAPVEYYDDEELDRFAGRQPFDYTPDEVEEFRQVLYTLLPADVSGWSASLQQRHIALPDELRDELIIMLNDT